MPYFDQTGQNRTQDFGKKGTDQGLKTAIEPVEPNAEKSPPNRGRPEAAAGQGPDGRSPLDDFYVGINDPSQDAAGIARGTVVPIDISDFDHSDGAHSRDADSGEFVSEEEAAADPGGTVTETDPDATVLEDLTIEELKEVAEEADIDLTGATLKDDIVEAVHEGLTTLDDLTIPQLRDLAKEKDVNLQGATRKAEIVDALKSALGTDVVG